MTHDNVIAMTKKQAFAYLKTLAKTKTWRAIAAELGVDEDLVYGWKKRERVPGWRVPAVEALAARQNGA